MSILIQFEFCLGGCRVMNVFEIIVAVIFILVGLFAIQHFSNIK